jgi:hypothetical protein
MGAVPAYLLSALIPVGWVLADLFLLSRRFNFITAFLGLNAIVRGLLAFWFVDGALYAFKDTVGSILIVLVFGGSLVWGHPLLGAFVAQALDPRTPEQEASLERLFAERPVARTLLISTAGLALLNAATAAINFVLNLRIVSAPFGTGEFNSQVARVNALTRLTLSVPEFLVLLALPALLPADGRRRAKGFLGTRRSPGEARTGACFGRSWIASIHRSAWKDDSANF